MLPQKYKGGTLRGAKIIAKSIAYAARERNDDIQVVFSYVDDKIYDPKIDFDDLPEYGISLRPTTWETIDLKTFAGFRVPFLSRALHHPLVHDKYCLPRDGLNDFYDCDFWVVISDRLPAPIYPIRKYACVAYDYIQRYVPDIFSDDVPWDLQEDSFFPVAREAERVFVTTPSTFGDAVTYVGIPKERVFMLPINFEPLDAVETYSGLGEYFIWTTNSSYHKNHINSFNALDLYYSEFDGKLDIVMTGANVEYFHLSTPLPDIFTDSHLDWCRNKLQTTTELARHVHVMANLSDKTYAQTLCGAKFLWHTALYDNGTYSALEAAWLGRPTLSARYPAMEFINQDFSLNLSFFDAQNARETAKMLKWMEENYTTLPLPSREALLNRGWKVNASVLYQAITELL